MSSKLSNSNKVIPDPSQPAEHIKRWHWSRNIQVGLLWVSFTVCLGGWACLTLGPMVGLVRWSLAEVADVSSSATGPTAAFYQPGTYTSRHYTDWLQSPFGWSLAGFTILLAGCTTLWCLLLGIFLASCFWYWSARGQHVALLLLLLPKLTNSLILIYGLQLCFLQTQQYGQRLLCWWQPAAAQTYQFRTGPWLHSFMTVLLGEVYLLLPLAVLLLWAGLLNIDQTLVQAARGCGASRWQCWWWLIWPLLQPTIWRTAQLCLLFSAGSFLCPLLLGSPQEWTVTVEIHRQAFEYLRWPTTASLAILWLLGLLLFSLGMFLPIWNRLK